MTATRARDGRERGRRGGSSAATGCLIGLLVLAGLVIGGIVVLMPAVRGAVTSYARENPQAMRVSIVADMLREELAGALSEPASTDPSPIPVVIEQGMSVERIAQTAADAGVVRDPLALMWHVITLGLDGGLRAGTFTLDGTLTPEEVARRLAGPPDPPTPKVTLAFRPALRIEQMAAYLATVDGLSLDAKEFYRLVSEPPKSLVADYPFLDELPRGASLEGFMGAGVFEVDADITPEALVRRLLDDWGAEVGDELVAKARRNPLGLYGVVTIASLVERETGTDKERDTIAGAYLNRLDRDLNPTLLMDADPTVIYAADTMRLRDLPFRSWPTYLFWDTLGVASLADVAVSKDLQSWQTYVNPGLPKGPIATPSAASIAAVLSPDRKDGYLFFYACPGSDTHRFAKSYADHQANIARCSG